MNLSTTDEPEKKYLLQIHRIKLLYYIQQALIAPDRYFDDEIEKDMQSKNPNFLVVSDGYIDTLNEYQILLELVFTEEEQDNLKKVGNCFYFDFPLPLTRIKKIYFQDNSIIKHLKANTENQDKGYLNEALCGVYKKRNKIIFNPKTYAKIDGIEAKDYSEKIVIFDKRMGMFAFIKNVELYYCDKTLFASNYSKHYFLALSYFVRNDEIKDKFEDLNVLKKDDDFKKLLLSNEQIDGDFIKKHLEKIESEKIKDIFQKLLKPNKDRQTLAELSKEDDLLCYLIGLVYYLRHKNTSDKKDSFKAKLDDIIPYERAEIAFAIIGLYNGYKLLRKGEEISIEDRYFKKIFGNEANIKFKMNSKLDYITVESIYNYSFHKKRGDDFSYLEFPKKPTNIKLPERDREFKIFYDVEIQKEFDVDVVKINKKSFDSIVNEKRDKYKNERLIFGKDHIFSYVAKYISDIIEGLRYGKTFELTCKKDEAFKKMGEEKDRTKQNEIMTLFKADGKG